MDVIVICGGKGTRVSSITKDEIPKILIPVNDKPFIEYLIETLYSQGARNIVFAAGFKGDVLKEYFETRKVLSSRIPWPNIKVLIETEPLDTGGAVLNVLDASGYGLHSNPFLIVNGDTLVIPDGSDSYEHLYYTHDEEGPWGDFCILSCRKDHGGRYGSLVCEGNDIIRFKNGVPGRSWINCGWYLVRREVFAKYYNPICNRDKIQTYDVFKTSMEEDIIPTLIKDGFEVRRLDIKEDQFIEIGTPEALEVTSHRLKE
jgi:D-glycero-alpha-D-manno-heptose 1-phosphate guanylyltransferase